MPTTSLGNGQHCLDRCVAFRLLCLFMPMLFQVSVCFPLLLCRVCTSRLCLHAGVKTFYNRKAIRSFRFKAMFFQICCLDRFHHAWCQQTQVSKKTH